MASRPDYAPPPPPVTPRRDVAYVPIQQDESSIVLLIAGVVGVGVYFLLRKPHESLPSAEACLNASLNAQQDNRLREAVRWAKKAREAAVRDGQTADLDLQEDILSAHFESYMKIFYNEALSDTALLLTDCRAAAKQLSLTLRDAATDLEAVCQDANVGNATSAARLFLIKCDGYKDVMKVFATTVDNYPWSAETDNQEKKEKVKCFSDVTWRKEIGESIAALTTKTGGRVISSLVDSAKDSFKEFKDFLSNNISNLG